MDGLRRDGTAFMERVTVRELLGVPPGAIERACQIAHQLYRAGRLAEADVVCRGLIACDHRLAWTYSLHAAVLRRLGRLEQALAQTQRGLNYEPAHAKLRNMRDELLALRTTPSPPRVADAAAVGPAGPVHDSLAQRTGLSTDSDP
jgi:predicted Zn-dependent protease